MFKKFVEDATTVAAKVAQPKATPRARDTAAAVASKDGSEMVIAGVAFLNGLKHGMQTWMCKYLLMPTL